MSFVENNPPPGKANKDVVQGLIANEDLDPNAGQVRSLRMAVSRFSWFIFLLSVPGFRHGCIEAEYGLQKPRNNGDESTTIVRNTVFNASTH